MRKLASIQRISSIEPIKDADKIMKATVLGWEVVIRKDEFSVGDVCVYIEVDSVLPDRSEFEFMRDRKFRVRTIKLKGQISQGICFPINILPSPYRYQSIGTDVTEVLGITKYLSPTEQAEIDYQNKQILIQKNRIKKYMMKYSWFRRLIFKKKRSGFPDWVSKTDEERIQNIPQVLEQFKNHTVYVTEKIDYQSVTFTGFHTNKFKLLGKLSPKKYNFIVCSRNFVTNDKNSLYWKIAEKYNIYNILKHNPHLTIQGEQGGPGIQGNKYGLNEPVLFVFNIIDHNRNYHYNFGEMQNFCKKHGLITVPFLFQAKIKDIGCSVNDWIEESKNISEIADIQREGIVVRCVENGKKILSFKVINPEFLLKYE